MLEELDIPLNDSRQRNVPPAPKLRGGRAGDPGDGGGAGIMPDGDLLLLPFRERLLASMTIARPGQQQAGAVFIGS